VNYSDNGIGLNKKSNLGGLGATTIKTRLHILRGEIIASNEENQGFKMSFIMPHGED
jgi:signal transduction histidine kinase